MRVLVVGNSQAGGLYRAFKKGLLVASHPRTDFYVVPGGTGPTLKVDEEGRLKPNVNSREFPPYFSSDDVVDARISDYDAIVFSALGYVDGGHAFKNPITLQGLVAEFDPKPNELSSDLVSESVFKHILSFGFRQRQHGFMLLAQLAKRYSGKVIVQPFPYVAASMRSRDDWWIRRCYRDHELFYGYLCQLRNSLLAEICIEFGATLLPHPDGDWPDKCFTPDSLVEADQFHANASYGALVLEQIAATVSK